MKEIDESTSVNRYRHELEDHLKLHRQFHALRFLPSQTKKIKMKNGFIDTLYSEKSSNNVKLEYFVGLERSH